jgi:hypothetical protein
MKRTNLLQINGRDVRYPTNESNLAHVESSSQEKPRPKFFKVAHKFDAKCIPLRRPHGMPYIWIQT